MNDPWTDSPGKETANDHAAIAAELLERGESRRALRHIVKAIAAFPLEPILYLWAGYCLEGLSADIRDVLGWDPRRLTHETTAEEFYVSGLLHNPDDVLRTVLLVRLGHLAAESADHRLAARRYEEATIYESSSGQWHYLMAYHDSVDTGELQIAALRRAFRLDVELLLGIEDDPRWYPWRAEVKDLLRQEHHKASTFLKQAAEAVEDAERYQACSEGLRSLAGGKT